MSNEAATVVEEVGEEEASVPVTATTVSELRQQLKANRAAEAARRLAEPAEKGYVLLTFEEIDRNHAALTALTQRRVADGSSGPGKKLRRLLSHYYGEAHQTFKDLHHLIIKNNPVPPQWEDDQTIPIVIAERRQRLFEDLKRDTYPIPIVPDSLKLKSNDMPLSTIKGELGHQNRYGVEDIKVKLGYLYADEEDKDGE